LSLHSSDPTAGDIPVPTDQNIAFAAAHRHAGQVTAAPDTTCFFCDKKGHFKSECPERRRWEATKKAMNDTTDAILAVDSDDDYEGVW